MASFNSNVARPILIPEKAHSWPLGQVPLSVRLTNVLINIGCESLGDIHGLTYKQISEAKSCGKKTLDELESLVTLLQSGELTTPVSRNGDNSKLKLGSPPHAFIPQHARGWGIENLLISARLANVLRRMSIRVLGDLHGIPFQQVRAMKSCGRHTVAELEDLVNRVQLGELRGVEEANTEASTLATLTRIIDRVVEELPLRSRDLLLLYMGGTGDAPMTLEEIGVRCGLTRERVRQIMEKAVTQIRKGGGPLVGQLSDNVTEQCLAVVCPLTPEFLAHQLNGEATAACRYPLSFYIRLIGKIAPKLPAWPLGQKSSGMGDEGLAEIIRHLRVVLSGNATPLPLSAAFEQLKATNELPRLEAGQFLEALRRTDSLRVEFSPPDQFEVRLAKLRTREWARQVLSQAARPLTPEELMERGEQTLGGSFDPVTAFTLANVLKPEDGFFLLDRRAFGLRQHLRLPQRLWNAAKSDFYKLLHNKNRPISTAEVINDRLFEWESSTNAYELAQILREDDRFVDLGRFLFGLREWGIEEREHVYDLIPKVFAQANQPLTVSEISKALQSFRSLSTTSLPSLLRKHSDVRECGFGYYGLHSWGDAAKKFLASKSHFVNRVIARSEPPLTFGDVCRTLEIPARGDLADRLWRTIKLLPKVRIKPLQQTPETLLIHKSWSLARALHAVLAKTERSLPAYEIQWEINERFKLAFGEKSTHEVERCLQQNSLFLCNARGEYLLNKHLAHDEAEAANIRQMCLETLSSNNQILGCDDLLERLSAEGIEAENLSSDLLAALLRGDEAFEEIGSSRFRSR